MEEGPSTNAFHPMKAMWLSLPGAAMCSVPVGLYLLPQALPRIGVTVIPYTNTALVGILTLLVPLTAVTSRQAYQHCISTIGHPGTRMVLMISNFVSLGIALMGSGGLAAMIVALFIRSWIGGSF
jgi:hypothetical protein